jgi:hypothetical protein
VKESAEGGQACTTAWVGARRTLVRTSRLEGLFFDHLYGIIREDSQPESFFMYSRETQTGCGVRVLTWALRVRKKLLPDE